ncbi:hypothetical protein K438DRAFT_528337 [Mycena galopus ATCC 62051]|nr:hypothetical protein K438DRAFT_528337 [Mycena galopus ATCC 62051]
MAAGDDVRHNGGRRSIKVEGRREIQSRGGGSSPVLGMRISSLPSKRQISSPLRSGFVSPSRNFAETRLAAATAGFAGSGRVAGTRRGFGIGDLGGRGFSVEFARRSGGERSVEPRDGQKIRASAWLRRAGWVGARASGRHHGRCWSRM